ncbi:MAG TPA: GPR1/FUN34/YaaH family transporter [Candidatus Dormibacteraeota bacterium]|nr:GPR1/FUN34/YaaH family transporter [Candidatus Dormibacteraeota bacterium]
MSAEKPDALQTPHTVATGDPMPLGLVAFALSTFTMGTILAGWWADPGAQLALALPVFTAFGGVTQFVAAMWSLGRGQTISATFFGTFGALWGAVAMYQLPAIRTAAAAVVGEGIATTALGPFGVALGCLCFVALVVGFASLSWNAGLSATAFALALALLLLTWASFAQGNTLLEAIAGWAGMMSGALGFATAAVSCAGGGASRDLQTGRSWRLPLWTRGGGGHFRLRRGGHRHPSGTG